jgi:acyl-CoA thioesterase FadM
VQGFELITAIREDDAYKTAQLFLPRYIEEKCWSSFLVTCEGHDSDSLAELGIVIRPVRHRCEYCESMTYPVGEVTVRMYIRSVKEAQVRLTFEHFAGSSVRAPLVARGEQDLLCLVRLGERLFLSEWPSEILRRMREIMKSSD